MSEHQTSDLKKDLVTSEKQLKSSQSNESVYKKSHTEKEGLQPNEYDLHNIRRIVENPFSANPRGIMQLQRAVGNRIVAGMIQAKLAVGSVDDSYEQEADMIAEKVINTPESDVKAGNSKIQDEGEGTGSDSNKAYGSIASGIQRLTENEAGARPLSENHLKGFDADADVEKSISTGKSDGSPLSNQMRSYMEPRFGADFSGVRIHADGKAAQLNRKLGAQAFTHQQNIYMGEAKYDTGTDTGKRLLAHELTHVVQQTGSVQRTSIRPIQLRLVSNRIQRNVAAISEYIKEKAEADKKIGLYNFFNGLSVEKKRIAAQYVINKGKVTGIPAHVDEAEFKKASKSGFFSFKGLNWELFSEAIRDANAAKSSENSNDVSPMTKTGASSISSSVGSAGLSASGSISNWASASSGALSGIGTAASSVGVVAAVADIANTVNDLSTGGPMSDAAFGAKVANIDASLMDTGRGIATAVNIPNFNFSSGAAISSTAAVSAVGILAIARGAYNLIGGVLTYVDRGNQQSKLKALGDRKELVLLEERKNLDIRKKEFDKVNTSFVLNLHNLQEFQLKRAKTVEEKEKILKEIKEAKEAIAKEEKVVQEEENKVKELEILVGASKLGENTQYLNKQKGAATALKGAAMIVGGALILASAASPVGWILLAAAGIVGGIAAVYKWYRTRQRREKIVDQYLNLEASKKAEPQKSESLLRDELLQAKGFNSLEQCYYAIVNEMALEVYNKGIVGKDEDYLELIKNLGFDLSGKAKPTVEQIAKSLHT